MANFWVFTADHSGLPLATRLQEEGHRVVLVLIRPEKRTGKTVMPKTPQEAKHNADKTKYLLKNGNGLVKKMWAEEALPQIKRQDYVFFDQIYGWQYGDALFKRGVKVLGGSQVGYTLETERRDTLNMLKKMGFDVPRQKYFGAGASQQGVVFLQNLKDEMLFVFKSDNPKVITQVAYDSNEELIQKLNAERQEIDADGFLLQQKVEGYEFAVETWYQQGVPVIANVDIEAKKKYNEMAEIQTGCACGLTWPIPVDHPLRERVNAPFDKFAAKYVGTGFLDLSVIYDYREDKMYALEVCGCRPAYNAFYALLSLAQMPVGEMLMRYLDGKPMAEVFQEDFAASLRLFNDSNTADQKISIAKGYEKNFWIWDCHRSKGGIVTTGTEFGESTGITTAISDTPAGAFDKVRENYFKIQMPTLWARDDFDDTDEPGLPLSRYTQMKRLKLL